MIGKMQRSVMPVFLLLLSLLTTACYSKSANFSLTIAHLNDTHSHLEPAAVNLILGGEKTTAQLGGFARLKTALDQMRVEEPNLLLLHAGDAVQGTLFFTLFNGTVEYDFLNLLGVDAMTFGNHEFDRGVAAIPGWIQRSRFPWLSANIDFSLEPGIAPLVKPYLIKEINGELVAIIGVTTETTPQTTINPGKAVFNDAVSSTRRQVASLADQGINKIVLLSHLGYRQDMALAAQVSGVDVIVGGHSHTLLGDAPRLSSIGLAPDGLYPTEVLAPDGKRVLVLQAWQWGDLLGRLKIAFTPDGEVSSWTGGAVIPVGDTFTRDGAIVMPGTQPYQDIVNSVNQSVTARIVAENSTVAAALIPYAAQLEQFRKKVVAGAADDITIGLNSGPGPLASDSMLAAVPRAQVALLNYGGVRKGVAAGNITVGDVLEVMPFANTLVLVDLTGAELKQALEEDIAFLISKFGLSANAMPYLGGAIMTVQPTAANGSRVTALAIKDSDGIYQPLDPGKVYRTVTNAFVANGGDGFTAIKNAAGFRSDTGIIDSDAFRDHLKKLGTIRNPTEQRITILPAVALL
jgi:5'-nucleotidase